MCGIVGYVGKKEAQNVLLEGLKRLEYRGYDSSGIAISQQNKILVQKAIGKISNLEEKLKNKKTGGTSGICHTRWATHGEPTEKNAHPHLSCDGNIAIVHNGIIENYSILKKELIAKGHHFISETDSEVIAHLVEAEYQDDLKEAVLAAIRKVEGTYGIAVVARCEPGRIIAARSGSPLVVGLGSSENFVASDVAAILGHTNQVIYLNDGEVADLSDDNFEVTNALNQKVKCKIDEIEWSLEESEKGAHKHFMIKEILEQPEVIKNSMRGRLHSEDGTVKLGGLESVEERLRDIERIIIIGCGTARFAGLVGEYMFEEYAEIPTEVEYASEFRYRKPIIDKNTAVIAISQSGETADTLAAVREAKRKGALTLGIVNAVGSTIARETDAGVYNHAGPEIAVASTKAFVSQLVVLALITVMLGRQRRMSEVMGKRITSELALLPEKVLEILKQREKIEKLASKYTKYGNFMYLGRKYCFPLAEEGALKLKEISYIHAEGYASGEMKHGPIALIDENFPSFFIAPKDSVYEKNISNIEEIKARKGKIIVLTTKEAEEVSKLADDVIYIPKSLEMLTPILAVAPLQLFSYYVALKKHFDVDKPRNLAKSVTVE
ncbi:MAG: glutamine--fructose-6-phosphate transaminase (isomerizing) [Bacteriovoracaceae bacterium]